MNHKNQILKTHPKGESKLALAGREPEPVTVDTYAGRIHVEWDPQAAVTPLGQLPFFIELLKTGGLFEPWVEDCPLHTTSNNASKKRDLLGTLMLSMLSGHRRYAEITSIRHDHVNPPLLGMSKVCSEDAVRRAFFGRDQQGFTDWLQKHLKRCYELLLSIPWILDVDTTIKTIYGHQEGAVVGYNPHKSGRPSHVYHTYFAANIRLVLDVVVQAGNQTASKYALPGLWQFIDNLPLEARPQFVRGDCAWGNERAMVAAEKRNIPYLFKLIRNPKIKKLIRMVMNNRDWTPAGQGWEGIEETLQLSSWTRQRRVVVLRRKVCRGSQDKAQHMTDRIKGIVYSQAEFVFMDSKEPLQEHEYQVLVTSLQDEILTIAQHYRDRADAENNFDEMKNQWGWCGYTTQDIGRCQIMARLNALVYNWWSLHVRLVIPEKHAEAVTSRPLLMSGVAKQTQHGGQTTITITSMHGKAEQAKKLLTAVAQFFEKIRATAEQLTWEARWRLILSHIFRWFLKGKILESPVLLLDSS